MAYNLTYLDQGNTTLDFITGLNTSTEGKIGLISLFIIWIILFTAFKNYDSRVGAVASSFIITLLTTIFWALGWVGFGIIFYPVAVLFLSLMWFGLTD